MHKEVILQLMKRFFPQNKYQEADIVKGLEDGDILLDRTVFANKFKGALHDENIVEVEFVGLSRVFFCRILDHPPEVVEKSSEEESEASEIPSTAYEKGSYLTTSDHLIATPLEPSIGNFLICSAPEVKLAIILRIVTSRQAFEFGCYFDAKVHVDGMPVLRLSFPEIARRIEQAREFRAKIPATMQFEVDVELQGRRKKFSTFPLDISPNGMVLVDPMGRDTDLKVDEPLYLDLKVPGYKPVFIEAHIRHVTKLRYSKGIQYCFGIQFDLATRALASSIEGLVALVQRTHLRELAEIAEKFGVNYDGW